VDISKEVSVSLVENPRTGERFYVITNRTKKLVAVKFEYKMYDKDRSYLGGETFDTLAPFIFHLGVFT
jgi:hypothetical protein